MYKNPLIQDLQDRVPAGPHADSIKSAIADALGASGEFAARANELKRSNKYTASGLKDQLTADLRSSYAAKLNNARRPVKALRQKLDALRGEIKPKALDKSDLVGELQRQELRSYLLDLKPEERVKLAMADSRFAEAALGAPLQLSGLPETVYEDLLKAHLKAEHGDKLQEVATIEDTLEAAEAALQVAENNARSTLGDTKAFGEAMASVRHVPWLKRQGDKVDVVFETDAGWRGRPATPQELQDGKYFTDVAEYMQANGLGNGAIRPQAA